VNDLTISWFLTRLEVEISTFYLPKLFVYYQNEQQISTNYPNNNLSPSADREITPRELVVGVVPFLLGVTGRFHVTYVLSPDRHLM
jgi:hypothetical protein